MRQHDVVRGILYLLFVIHRMKTRKLVSISSMSTVWDWSKYGQGSISWNVFLTIESEHSYCYAITNLWNWVSYTSIGLVQERRNSSALAMELRLSCINPSKCLCLYMCHEITCIIMKSHERIIIHIIGEIGLNYWIYFSASPLSDPLLTCF